VIFGFLIKIGNHVWIGNDVKIYKGTVIPNNCVIASHSVVKGVFTQENSLIAGCPAKLIKKDVTWE
jgi:acetyltransferase-like isoleucine patch superfamily enzyme